MDGNNKTLNLLSYLLNSYHTSGSKFYSGAKWMIQHKASKPYIRSKKILEISSVRASPSTFMDRFWVDRNNLDQSVTILTDHASCEL